MATFALPPSGIEVTFPKARILQPHADPVARGVVPDVAIEAPIVPTEADVVLDAALQEVLKHRPREPSR